MSKIGGELHTVGYAYECTSVWGVSEKVQIKLGQVRGLDYIPIFQLYQFSYFGATIFGVNDPPQFNSSLQTLRGTNHKQNFFTTPTFETILMFVELFLKEQY